MGGIPPAEPIEFRSDIFKQTPQIEASESERWKEARAEGAGVGTELCESLSDSRNSATNWDVTGAAKWADLSRTRVMLSPSQARKRSPRLPKYLVFQWKIW